MHPTERQLPNDVPRRRSRWHGRLRLSAGAMGLLVCACTPARAPAVKTISLRMQGTPADASVVVDDESVGQLDFVHAHGVALPPGVHHITVKAEGYFPYDREVEAKPGSAPIELDVALTAVPD